MNDRRLYRSQQDKMLFGVSGGLADYFDVDVSLVRLGWVLACILSGGVLALAYLVMGLITPTYFQLYGEEEDDIGMDEEEPAGDEGGEGDGDGEGEGESARRGGQIGREERRRARRHRRKMSLGRGGGAGMLFGLVLVVIGGIALLNTTGIFGFFNFWQMWPVIVIGIGAMILWKRRDR